MKNKNIEEMFQNKLYKEIVEELNNYKRELNTSISSESVRIVAVFAFSFYHTGNFSNAIRYGNKVVNFIEENNDTEVAHELIESLVVIIFDSYLKLRRKVLAYFFAKKFKKLGMLRIDIQLNMNTLREQVSRYFEKILENTLIGLGLLVVLLQNTLNIIDQRVYIVLIFMIVAILLLVYFKRGFIQKYIYKII